MFLPDAVAGNRMCELFAFDVDDFGNPGNFGGSFGSGLGVVARDEHMHVAAALAGSGDGVEGSGPDARVVVFCNYKRGH